MARLHRNLKIRIAESFVSSMLGNMLFPFLTIYFVGKFGASLTGVLMTCDVVIGMFVSFYGGHLGDRIGRRKTMLIAEVIRFAAFVLMILANSPWFEWPWVTFAMSVLISVTWGLAGPAADAMIIDVSTTENRKLVYSIMYWSHNGAMVIGSLIGGFLFQSHRFEIYLGVTAGSLMSLLLLLFFIQETFVPAPEKKSEKKPSQLREFVTNYKLVFQDRTFLWFVFSSMLIGSIEWQARNYAGVRLAGEFGNQTIFSLGNWSLSGDGVRLFGLLAAENSLLVVLCGVFLTMLLKRWSDRFVLNTGILTHALGYAVIGFSNSPLLLFLMMALATFGELCWVPVQQSLTAELPPADNRSAYMAVLSLAFRGQQILGSLAVTLGAFLPSWGMGAVFMATGLVAMVLNRRILPQIAARKQSAAVVADAPGAQSAAV